MSDGTIERTAQGGAIRFVRHLPYDVREVWDAITTPERLGDWWLPFDAEITVDLREGGAMVFTGESPEGPISITCSILRVEAPLLLEHTHPDGQSHMRWELEPTDTGTTLRLSHEVTDVAGAVERCYIVGLHTSLSRLEPALAGKPEAWDWNDFAASQARYAALGFAPVPEEAS